MCRCPWSWNRPLSSCPLVVDSQEVPVLTLVWFLWAGIGTREVGRPRDGFFGSVHHRGGGCGLGPSRSVPRTLEVV